MLSKDLSKKDKRDGGATKCDHLHSINPLNPHGSNSTSYPLASTSILGYRNPIKVKTKLFTKMGKDKETDMIKIIS